MNAAVTLTYDGSGQPAHIRSVYRWQGLTFISGEPQTVPDDVAGHILATTEALNGFKVVTGKPRPWSAVNAQQSRLIEAERVAAATFLRDPAAELANMPVISAKALAVCRGAGPKAVEAIEAGTLDGELQTIALWAQFGGRAEVAAAAARRFQARRLAR